MREIRHPRHLAPIAPVRVNVEMRDLGEDGEASVKKNRATTDRGPLA
jgi:hypothetical protein